jgi:long-chain acyl-CoA synthetase
MTYDNSWSAFLIEHSSTNPMINKLHTMRETIESCPQISWSELSQINPTQVALVDEHLCDDQIILLTFKEMNDIVTPGALMFESTLGLQKKQHVAIFGENSALWLQIDHSIQCCGGVTAVRGANAPLVELRYLHEHSNSACIVVLQGPKL